MKDDLLGQTLGQYRLESLLGSGGMGQVYRGIHRLLDRPAAIKVMLASYASNAQFRARFLQEAKVVAALRHPNIVEIYEFGEQDGTLFLVMELMNDGSLLTLLRGQSGQPLPLAQAMDLGSQIAEGLAAAHAKQVVHRDIKPANLLLQRPPGSVPNRDLFRVKINDFGLARLMEGGVETMTGAPMGTLAYMSPEQCIGNRQIDGRSDLYATGVVLYEMVTGYQPFQINGVTDALYKHVNVPPPSPREIRPDLPPMLEEIIMRCLAKKPEERFTNGAALANALQSVLGNTGEKTTATVSQQYSSTRTTLESPAAQLAPPTVSTMPGYSDKPRVRVLDQNGETLQVAEVRPQGLIVGRQQGNDIVLLSQSVSRQHLLILWDGTQVKAKDLGSSNGTTLDGARLLPDVEQIWQERQSIRLGAFWLRLEGASAPLTAIGGQDFPRFSESRSSATTVPSSRAGMSSPSLVSGRIGLAVTPKTLTITPGQPNSVQITLTNIGSTVDWFTPTVEGVPPEWVQGANQEVQLNPGMQESLNLVVNVARQPMNRAMDYPVIIRVRSREQPQDFATTHATWIVQPFREDTLRLEPRRATGRGKADYTVALNNASNSPARYILSGDDDEQKLTYRFHLNPLDLQAGQDARIPLTVRARRHLFKREERVPFQLHAGLVNTPLTQTIPGEFVNKPLLPRWIVPAFLAAVLITAGILGVALGLVPLPGQAQGGTPTPNIGATLTAIVQSGANTATVNAISAQATTGANATATAGANASATVGANASATAGTDATATAGAANATATAQASATTQAQLAAQYDGTWTNTDPNTRDMFQVVITSSGDTLTIHGYGACSPPCDWGTVDVQFTGSPIVATFVFDGSRPGACCTGADTQRLTITFASSDQTQLQVVDTNLRSNASNFNMMSKP